MSFGEFYSAAKDRFTSTIGFSVALSWVAINYDFLIILFSGATPMEKIQLINNQLYFSGAMKIWCWLILPIAVGCLYTFGYPYVDIQISSFLERIKVHKEKRLLAITRTIPIAANVQYEYFEKFDEEIDKHKSHLQKVMLKRNDEVSRLRQLAKELEDKNSRMILKDFCNGTRISPANIPWLVEYDKGTYSEMKLEWQEDYEDFAAKKEFPWLLRLANESRYRDISIDDLRIVSEEQITDTCVGGSDLQRAEYLDLVLALKLVTRFEDLFHVEPLRMDGIINIQSEVAKMAASRGV